MTSNQNLEPNSNPVDQVLKEGKLLLILTALDVRAYKDGQNYHKMTEDERHLSNSKRTEEIERLVTALLSSSQETL